MKILTCYHFPISREARIADVSVYDNPKEIKRRIGYLPKNAPAYAESTIEEALSFAADVRGLSTVKKRERIEKVLSECSLDSVRSRSTETVSKGFRQRLVGFRVGHPVRSGYPGSG